MLNKHHLVIRNIFIVVVQPREWRQITSQARPPGRTVPTEIPRTGATPAQIDHSLISSLYKVIIPFYIMLLVSRKNQLAGLLILFKTMIYVGMIFSWISNSILNQLEEGMFIERARDIFFRAKFRWLIE